MFKRKQKRTMQQVAEAGDILASPEYLTMCAKAIKEHCENTRRGQECIFGQDGTCDAVCSVVRNTPDFWPEDHWRGVKR